MTCTSKTRIRICERGFFKPNAIQDHFLSHLKLKMSHASCKSVTRTPEANFGWYMWAMAWRTAQSFITFTHLFPDLFWGPLPSNGELLNQACANRHPFPFFYISKIPFKYVLLVQTEKIMEGQQWGAFQNFQTPPKQWRKEPTGNIPSNHTKK
jgi:hypothetical protein